jgi:hypothetical protein
MRHSPRRRTAPAHSQVGKVPRAADQEGTLA